MENNNNTEKLNSQEENKTNQDIDPIVKLVQDFYAYLFKSKDSEAHQQKVISILFVIFIIIVGIITYASKNYDFSNITTTYKG